MVDFGIEVIRAGGRCVGEALELQRSLLVGPTPPPPANGFLVSVFEPEELTGILADGGRLYVSYDGGRRLQGYALIAPIDHFIGFFAERSSGVFLPDSPVRNLSRYEYLYQIVVAREAARHGIGTALLNACRSTLAQGLIADYLIEPHHNQASMHFFHKAGFRAIGTLRLSQYLNFGPLATQVVAWR